MPYLATGHSAVTRCDKWTQHSRMGCTCTMVVNIHWITKLPCWHLVIWAFDPLRTRHLGLRGYAVWQLKTNIAECLHSHYSCKYTLKHWTPVLTSDHLRVRLSEKPAFEYPTHTHMWILHNSMRNYHSDEVVIPEWWFCQYLDSRNVHDSIWAQYTRNRSLPVWRPELCTLTAKYVTCDYWGHVTE